MIDKILEQRISLKFLTKLKKTPSESYKLLQDVYGDSVLSKECVFEWHKLFSEGREEILDDTRPDHPTTQKTSENVERVRQLVRSNRRISTRMIADKLRISKETVRRILTVDLRMRKIFPRSINSGGKANVSGVDWSTEEIRRPEEVGDSVTSTSTEDGKHIQKKSSDPQSNNVFFQEHFGSKVAEPDGEVSEGSDVGEWYDAEAAVQSAEGSISREEHAVHGVVIKQERVDEDDYVMDEDFNSAADENGGCDETEDQPWNSISPPVRMINHPSNQEHLGSNAPESDRELSDGSDVGEWDDADNLEAAGEAVEHPEAGEEHAVHEVMVKQEVMDEEMEDESYNTAENGEFEETEEPPWDNYPLDDIPAVMNMDEYTASNQVEYDDSEAMNSLDQNEDQSAYICHYCNQSFLKQRQLYGHMAMHSRKGFYPKASTPRGRSTAEYSRPMAKVRNWLHVKQAEMKFTCIDCYQEFIGVGPFTSHKGMHRQKDKKFHCSVCSQIYPRAIDLIFHEWTNHTGDRPFPCDRCPSSFARQTSWTYHIIAHINHGSKFPSGRNRINPSSQPQVSPSPESPSNSEVVTQRTLSPRKAAIEGRVTSQLGAMVTPMGAMVTPIGAYPFKCRTCGKGILNEESWEYHLVVHPDGGETRQKLSPTDLESLRAQLRTTLTCENKAKITCLQCGLEIIGVGALAKHKSQQHLTKGGYRCTVCAKGVENVQKFIRHEMSHTKVKIYMCEMCGREMADRMSFIHHIIVHFKDQQLDSQPVVMNNIQPVVTEVPKQEEGKDRSFHHLVQKLLDPIKAHLKEELVPCLQCGQVFVGIQRLVTHKETHTNNSAGSHTHACWVCAEAFESAKILVEHEWIHTGMKPYKCDKCDQKFSSKIAWVNHLRGHFLEGKRNRPN